jgi:hypothetical protein
MLDSFVLHSGIATIPEYCPNCGERSDKTMVHTTGIVTCFECRAEFVFFDVSDDVEEENDD